MTMDNSKSGNVPLDSLVAKAMVNVIRFKEIRPNWLPAALDGNPAWQIPIYKYTDGIHPNLSTAIPCCRQRGIPTCCWGSAAWSRCAVAQSYSGGTDVCGEVVHP